MADADIIRRFQAQQARIINEVSRAAAQAWASLFAYDRENVAEFLALMESIVPVGQTAMGTLVDAYMAHMAESSPVGVPEEVLTGARGVDLATAYERPFLQLWKGLSDGGDYAKLVGQSGSRVVKMAATDQQLAMRAATDHVVEAQPKIVGYRRVLTGKSCMFCASASTRRYHGKQASIHADRAAEIDAKGNLSKAEKRRRNDHLQKSRNNEAGPASGLMPLHSGCDCGVAPIIGTRDPGVLVNENLLDRLKDAGPDYWKQRGFVDPEGNPVDPTDIPSDLVEIEHTEIGPVVQAA